MSDDGSPAKKQKVMGALSPISTPLADDKLTKRLYKIVKKSAEAKTLRRGVKEVVKALRKDQTGLCIIAGDIAPIDVISHIPLFCEEKEVPYIYVRSKSELGGAANTKRPTSVVLVVPKDGVKLDKWEKVVDEVKGLAPKFT